MWSSIIMDCWFFTKTLYSMRTLNTSIHGLIHVYLRGCAITMPHAIPSCIIIGWLVQQRVVTKVVHKRCWRLNYKYRGFLWKASVTLTTSKYSLQNILTAAQWSVKLQQKRHKFYYLFAKNNQQSRDKIITLMQHIHMLE